MSLPIYTATSLSDFVARWLLVTSSFAPDIYNWGLEYVHFFCAAVISDSLLRSSATGADDWHEFNLQMKSFG